jgi:hypothetical protein
VALLVVLGLLASVVAGLAYLAVALWWFRPVEDGAALQQLVLGRGMFVGTIPRMNP